MSERRITQLFGLILGALFTNFRFEAMRLRFDGSRGGPAGLVAPTIPWCEDRFRTVQRTPAG